MRSSTSLSHAQEVLLDAIRGGAALMVLLGHTAWYFLPQSRLAGGALQGMGVALFFLISGFLISYSVLRRLGDSGYDFRSYFIDRFCRIYCALLPALLLVVLLDTLAHNAPSYRWSRDFTPETLVGNALMLQDFPVFRTIAHLTGRDSSWLIGPFGSARPLWTISIEWWIYMLFGGLVLVLLRRGRRLGLIGAGALAVAALEPVYHFLGGYAQGLIVLWILGSAASYFFLRLAAAQSSEPEQRRRLRVAWVVAAAAAIALPGRLAMQHDGGTVLSVELFLAVLVLALIVALGLSAPRVPGWLSRPVTFIAGYSYSLYLTHHTLLELLSTAFPTQVGHPLMFVAALVLANLLAIAFWAFFERHHRHAARWLKQRLSTQGPSFVGTPAARRP